MPRPAILYFEITRSCNCRCRMCNRYQNKHDNLSLEEIKKILSQAKNLGVRFLSLTGGEPLLRPDFFEIVEYASSMGFELDLATNGTLINETNVKKIAKFFPILSISLEGLESTHDYLRGAPGSFKRVLRAIDLLNNEGVKVSVNTTLSAANYTEIEEIIRLCKRKKVVINFTPLHNVPSNYYKVKGDVAAAMPFNFDDEWRKILGKHSEMNTFFYACFAKFFRRPAELRNQFLCFAGIANLFISAEGDVYPCAFNPVNLGNLREKSLIQIWRDAKQVQKQISSRKRKCVCWTHCNYPISSSLTRFVSFKIKMNGELETF